MATLFAQNLRHLRKRSLKTQEQLGQELRLGRTTIANYEAGVSGPTDPDVLIRLSHLFGVSIDELLTRDLASAFTQKPSGIASPGIGEPIAGLIQQRSMPKAAVRTDRPQVVVADREGREQIACVSRSAAETYNTRRTDATWIGSLPLYTIPGLAAGDHRIFEVSDGAMAPRFSTGDRVVCRWTASAEEARDGCAYIFVTDGQPPLLRRVVNRVADGGGLLLIADGGSSGPTELRGEALRELWAVQHLISAELAAPIGQVYGKIADLERQLQALARRLGERDT